MADIDVSNPGVPGYWFKKLAAELALRAPGYDLLDRYYTNDVAAPVTANKVTKDAYKRLMGYARTNYAELVVDAPRERMAPLGFRTGAVQDDTGDTEAWRIWQANGLDADVAIMLRTALSMGRAYMMVGGYDADLGAPTITVEDPRQVITIQHPTKRRVSVAGLKLFTDTYHDQVFAYLFVGDRVFRYWRDLPRAGAPLDFGDAFAADWNEDTVDQLPVDFVPLVEITPRSINGEPYGEYETHLGVLDRINYGILQRLEIATMQAFKQRAIKGIPSTDNDGNPIDYTDVFSADPGAMWHLPETADIWESKEVDLGPIRASVRDDVQDLAAGTRTPLFYLTPDANNGSAEGASLAREGLIFKTRDRLAQVGESLEQTMAMAFAVTGDTTRARRAGMEVIWANPEHFSLAEKLDAAAKANAAGMTWTAVMTDILQMSPQQIERMRKERDAEQTAAAEVRDAQLAIAQASQPAPAMMGAGGQEAPPPPPEGP